MQDDFPSYSRGFYLEFKTTWTNLDEVVLGGRNHKGRIVGCFETEPSGLYPDAMHSGKGLAMPPFGKSAFHIALRDAQWLNRRCACSIRST
jgi:hypothetical protein